MPDNGAIGEKIIRDVIHGYISVNEEDLKIIDTPHFQRLRRIRQGYVQTVYPCANHTRFEHSLGVMDLGTKVIRHLRNQLTEEFGIRDNQYEKYFLTVRYACLLHDIGHAPFSHLGEKFYSADEMRAELNKQLKRLGVSATLEEKGSPHELCSCALALEIFGDYLLKRGTDVELFCRMITGEEYDSGDRKIENILIHILNSDADVDKLDYCLRDAFMTGAKIVVLDVDRLISSIIIKDDRLAFSGKSLSTIGNLVYGREAVYIWIVNHHIAIYTDCLFERLISHLIKKTALRENYFSYSAILNFLIDDYDIISFIRQHTGGDKFADNLYIQLFNRQYYKSLWKSFFDYQNTPAHQSFTKLVGKYEDDLDDLENKIIAKHKGKFFKGDFFITLAQFKPFSPIDELWISIDNRTEPFEKVFCKNFTKDPKKEIPYVFTKKEIKDEFLRLINEGNLL